MKHPEKEAGFIVNMHLFFSVKPFASCFSKSRYFLMLCCLFLFLGPTCFSQFSPEILQNYIYKKWDIENGLPQKSVNEILHSENGYLWVATYEGFSRFDGVNFETFDKTNIEGLKNNIIYALEEDADNNIWAGTNGSGVIKYKKGRTEVFSTENGMLLNDVVRDIYSDSKGYVWIATDGGLHRYRDGKMTTHTSENGFSEDQVDVIMEDNNGNLWVSVYGKGIDVFKDGKKIKYYTTSDGLLSNSVLSFCKDKSGTMWIGTRTGLSYFRDGEFKTVHQKGVDKKLIESLHYDKLREVVWVGTDEGNLLKMENENLITLVDTGFEINSTLNSIITDSEGNIWIGLYKNGLFRMKKAVFNTLLPNGQGRNVVKVVGKSNSKRGPGKLYVGSDKGLAILEDGEFSRITQKEGLTKNQVTSLLEDSEGNLWVGTYRGMLNKIFPNGNIIHYKPESGLTDDFISVIFQDSRGKLWVGTYGSGLFYLENQRFRPFSDQNDTKIDSEIIRVIFESRSGDLWMGTNTGVIHVSSNGVEKLTTENGLSFKTVVSIYQDENDDGIWFGTRGGGLNYYKDGEFTVCSMVDGLFNDVVYAILDDGLGFLWMSCNKGIYSVEKQQLYDFVAGKTTHINSKSYGIDDGMKSIECNGGFAPAACKTDDGKLCFPTAEGLVVIDPTKVTEKKTTPITDIQVVQVNANKNSYKVYGDSTMVFDKKIDRLEIDYTSLSFTSPQKTIFRTRLDGMDKDWVQVDTRRIAYYTNLPYGKLTFRVSASNKENQWSKEAILTLVIPPPFWLTTWFRILVIISLASLLYFLYRRRIRIIENQKVVLEETVEKRTIQITRQKESLQQLNEEKNNIIAIVAHDLRTPLSHISGFASLLDLDNPNLSSESKNYTKSIIEATGRLSNMIGKILDINIIESKELKFSLDKAPIDGIVEESVDRHQLLAKKKEISLVFEAANDNYEAFIEKKLLGQAVDNLISNAIKFSPDNLNIVVNVSKFGEKIRVSIRDEGMGISKQDMPKLFGKFQKLTARPTGGEESTGLGLSIVKKYIEIMNGKVWCESEEGKGANFIIEI